MSRNAWQILAAVALPVLLVACAPKPKSDDRYDETLVRTPCDATPRDHSIEVGAEVSCKEPHVSKSRGNLITWRSTGGENVEVRFAPKGGVNPFPDLRCPGSSPVCLSGRIAPGASGDYDYDIWLVTSSGRTKIDPRVIIDP